MHRSYLYLFFLFLLSGCINDQGLRSEVHPLSAVDLSHYHIYKMPGHLTYSATWWHQFNEPQLDQLIVMALKHSPDIMIAKSRIKKACYLAERSKGALWPIANFSGYLKKKKILAIFLI